MATSSPAETRRPVRTSYSSDPTGGEGEGNAGSTRSGVSAITRQTRCADTLARMNLLAYSVAVRSGIIRKAAYP